VAITNITSSTGGSSPLRAQASQQGLNVGQATSGGDPVSDEDHSDVEDAQILQDEGPQYGEARPGTLKAFLTDQITDINLARHLDQQTLDKLGGDVVREYNIDENSRADWLDRAEKALKFATQEGEEKQYPWPKASNVIWPLISQAAFQFGARAYPAMIQGKRVVKGIVWGSDRGTPMTQDGASDGKPKMNPDGSPAWLVAPGEKQARADRIGEHMSWQLLSEMQEWEPQTDALLHQMPVVGGAIRKTYRDPAQNRNFSLWVPLAQLVWNYGAPSFEAASRHTEIVQLYPHEILENELADEMFLPLEYGTASSEDGQIPGREDDSGGGSQEGADADAPHVFLEQHRRMDLDDDGYPEPYVVTVHKRSSKVVRIVARYDADGITSSEDGETILRIEPVEHYTLIPFLPNIEGGSYPMGFGHLLKPINEAINTSLNQMFDAGHLANAGGGFISDQLSIRSGVVQFQVGKYVRVGSKGQDIKDAVLPLPFKGPSAELFQLLGFLVTAGKEMAAIQDILTGSAEIANAPPTTILALIEQGMKLYTAIHKRIYRAFKAEFDKLYRLNRIYLTEDQRYRIGDEWRVIQPRDYRQGGGVEPVADPKAVTDMQKLARANLLLTVKDDPALNKAEIYRRLFEAADVERIDDLFAPPNPMAPQLQQMAIAEKQAEISREQAADLKDRTQSYLNLALARKAGNTETEAFIDAQMRMLELHIQSANSIIRAADVAHRASHGARKLALEGARVASDGTRAANPRAAAAGNDTGPVGGVEEPPGNGSVSDLLAGGGGQLPPGGNGPLGGGPTGI
jgi:chaperonin GroES